MDERPPDESLIRRLEALEASLGEVTERMARLESHGVDAAPAAPPPTPVVEEPKEVEEEPDQLADLLVTARRDLSGPDAVTRSVPRSALPSIGSMEPPPKKDAPPAPPEPSWLEDFLPEDVDWRELLRKAKLLPPETTGSVEMQVGTWWVTRIGAAFLVAFAVFLGVYVSRDAPTWLRLLEQTGLTVSVIGAGLLLERRLPKFGSVVFGAGLALLHYTAFAAYAIGWVKVIDSPVTAVIVQFAAVAITGCCALWRRSQTLASMGVLFGYLACMFSFFEGLSNHALIASLVLGAAGVWFYLHTQWQRPIQIAVPMTWLVFACVAVGWTRGRSPLPTLDVYLAYALTGMLLYAVADFGAMLRGSLMDRRTRRIVQICNTTSALLIGFLLTAYFNADVLYVFYFIFGGVLIAGAFCYYLANRKDVLLHVYFVKGSALITLGLIAYYDGQARWIAIAIEALVLLLSAKRSRLVIVEGAAAVAWLVSWLVFLSECGESALSDHDIWHVDSLIALAYALFSVTLLSLHSRWFIAHETVLSDSIRSPVESAAARNTAHVLLILASGVLGSVVAIVYGGSEYLPLTSLTIALAFGAIGWASRQWVAGAAGLVPFAMAHIMFWEGGCVAGLPGWDWINAFGLVDATAGLAVLLLLWTVKEKCPETIRKQGVYVDAALHALWLVALMTAARRTLSIEELIALGAALSVGAAAIASVVHFRRLADVSPAPMIFALCCLGSTPSLIDLCGEETRQMVLCLTAVVVAFGYAGAFAGFRSLRRRIRIGGTGNAFHIFHTVVAVAVTFVTLDMAFDGVSLMLAYALTAMAVAALARWPGLVPALLGAAALLAAAHARGHALTLEGGSSPTTELWSCLAVAALTMVYSVSTRRLRPELTAGTVEAFHVVASGGALALCFLVFVRQPGWVGQYATAFWALSSMVVLLIGLGDRAKATRIVGLLGFAVCTPRLVMIDIQDTVHRIFASGALGLTLLLVGYLYNRFQSYIEPSEAEGE